MEETRPGALGDATRTPRPPRTPGPGAPAQTSAVFVESAAGGRPGSDEDSMEPRAAAGAPEPGRARGSIGRSCRRHARGSHPARGPARPGAPRLGAGSSGRPARQGAKPQRRGAAGLGLGTSPRPAS